MWNPFKKKSPEEEVYKIFLYCNLQFLNISAEGDLTVNQKRQKCYKIFTRLGQYIHDIYGQKYLEFFEEKIYEKGWINKEIHEKIKNYE